MSALNQATSNAEINQIVGIVWLSPLAVSYVIGLIAIRFGLETSGEPLRD